MQPWPPYAPSDNPDWRLVWTIICPNNPALWGVCRHDLMYMPGKQSCILNLHVFMCVSSHHPCVGMSLPLPAQFLSGGGEINQGNFCWRQRASQWVCIAWGQCCCNMMPQPCCGVWLSLNSQSFVTDIQAKGWEPSVVLPVHETRITQLLNGCEHPNCLNYEEL